MFWKLLGGDDFVHDGLRSAAGIGGGQDWTADDEEISAGANGFGGSCGAGLVIILSRHGFFFWPHAGSNNQEIASAGFADRTRFFYGGHDAVDLDVLCDLWKFCVADL